MEVDIVIADNTALINHHCHHHHNHSHHYYNHHRHHHKNHCHHCTIMIISSSSSSSSSLSTPVPHYSFYASIDICPIAEVLDAAYQHQALVLVDEAHSTGTVCSVVHCSVVLHYLTLLHSAFHHCFTLHPASLYVCIHACPVYSIHPFIHPIIHPSNHLSIHLSNHQVF